LHKFSPPLALLRSFSTAITVFCSFSFVLFAFFIVFYVAAFRFFAFTFAFDRLKTAHSM